MCIYVTCTVCACAFVRVVSLPFRVPCWSVFTMSYVLCVCVDVCVRAHMCICANVNSESPAGLYYVCHMYRVCVCGGGGVSLHTFTCILTCVCVRACAHVRARTCVCVCVCVCAASNALGDCTCKAGYTGANGATCQSCEPGTFKAAPGPAACSACVSGWQPVPRILFFIIYVFVSCVCVCVC
jgi:hypothetical protein